jgi:hypothetical protein
VHIPHPQGPLGLRFGNCGSNHVIRYNEIYGSIDGSKRSRRPRG